MNCPTRSGHYQCGKTLGHEGPCEAQEESIRFPIGPYEDAWRGRAYLRGRLDSAGPTGLDIIAARLGIQRDMGETDCALRKRIWRSAQ